MKNSQLTDDEIVRIIYHSISSTHLPDIAIQALQNPSTVKKVRTQKAAELALWAKIGAEFERPSSVIALRLTKTLIDKYKQFSGNTFLLKAKQTVSTNAINIIKLMVYFARIYSTFAGISSTISEKV